MSSIKLSHLVITLAAACTLGGCGDKNSKAEFSPESGHASGWVTGHKTAARTSIESCRECHGENLDGGISRVSCMSASAISGLRCHATSPAENQTGCKSCHGTPPSAATAPNRAGAHAAHVALAGVTCDTCHSGGGSGTANHAKGNTTIAFPDSLKAKEITTTFGYTAASGKCSGMICHGGQVTPSWSTGTINTTTDCLKCHEAGTAPQTPQYNSFSSGFFPFPNGTTVALHQFHLGAEDPTSAAGLPITCSSCHDTGKLAVSHFSGLATPAFEGLPADTIGGGSTNVTVYSAFTTAVPSGSCTNNCHARRFWNN